MKTHLGISLAVVALLCGCARSITTAPYNLKARNSGVVYSLPKTRLKVTLTYTVVKRTKLEDGIAKPSTTDIFIGKPVVIEPVLASDTNNTFVLSGEKLVKDSRLDASFKFQVNDNQLLASVTSEALDKSPEIFQGLVGSGISIAKMAAVAGDSTKTPLKEIAAQIKKINQDIATLAAGNDSDKVDKIKKLLEEQAILVEAAKKYLELNGEKTEEKEVTYVRTLDLNDFTKGAGGSYEMDIAAPDEKIGVSGGPTVNIELALTDDQWRQATAAFFPSNTAPADKSIVYRVPTPVRVKATIAGKSLAVFDDDIPFAQVGPFNSVEARYKMWAKRKTSLTFSTSTGSLKEYGVESTSSAEAAAKALDTSLSKVQTAVGEIRKAQAEAEAAKKSPDQQKLAELEMQKKLVEAEAALLKAQKELEELQNASEAK